MIRFPTIRQLQQIRDADHALMRAIGKAQGRQAVFDMSTDAQRLTARCYTLPSVTELRLVALNQAARTHGVESIPYRGGFVQYLNTGESYAPTLVRYPSGLYAVKSWAEIVEARGYREM